MSKVIPVSVYVIPDTHVQSDVFLIMEHAYLVVMTAVVANAVIRLLSREI